MEKGLKNAIDFNSYEKSPQLAEVSVSYKSELKDFIKISNSREAFNILYPLFDPSTIELKEEFVLLFLDRANHILGWFKLSSGGTSGTVVDVKLIFMLCLQVNAHGVILCHNHPSQNIQPSEADVKLTRQIKEAGMLLDVQVLDHLIIAANCTYFTFADEGLI